jgi:cytoskeletal protein RodZ
MNKKNERIFVMLSIMFIVLIVAITWLYMLVYERAMQGRQSLVGVKTEEQKLSDMIDRIQSADESKINQEDKNSMINNIKN